MEWIEHVLSKVHIRSTKSIAQSILPNMYTSEFMRQRILKYGK